VLNSSTKTGDDQIVFCTGKLPSILLGY